MEIYGIKIRILRRQKWRCYPNTLGPPAPWAEPAPRSSTGQAAQIANQTISFKTAAGGDPTATQWTCGKRVSDWHLLVGVQGPGLGEPKVLLLCNTLPFHEEIK